MVSIARRGDALRMVVRRRRRLRWLMLAMTAVLTAMFIALVIRKPDGLLITALAANIVALAVALAAFTPRLELRALRYDVHGTPLSRSAARGWALGGACVSAGAPAAALVVAVITGDWLYPFGVALPIALMGAIWALLMLREARRVER